MAFVIHALWSFGRYASSGKRRARRSGTERTSEPYRTRRRLRARPCASGRWASGPPSAPHLSSRNPPASYFRMGARENHAPRAVSHARARAFPTLCISRAVGPAESEGKLGFRCRASGGWRHFAGPLARWSRTINSSRGKDSTPDVDTSVSLIQRISTGTFSGIFQRMITFGSSGVQLFCPECRAAESGREALPRARSAASAWRQDACGADFMLHAGPAALFLWGDSAIACSAQREAELPTGFRQGFDEVETSSISWTDRVVIGLRRDACLAGPRRGKNGAQGVNGQIR